MSPHGLLRRALLQGCAGITLSALYGLGCARNAFAQSPASKTLRLAVVPQLTPIEMSRNWSPLVEVLGRAGIPCELVVYPSIAGFEREFLKGTADIAFLNPYHMVMARRAQKYEPLLHDTRPLEGVLVVKNDGPVKHIEQLKDHRISFPAPNAFAASLYIRSVLEKSLHTDYDVHYAGNHRNAIRQVLAGDSAAAGVVKTTLEREPPEIQNELRVLYTTPPLAPHPIAVHPRVPKATRQALFEIMRALAQTPATKSIMAAIQMPDPVVADYVRDYAPLERLKIEKFVVIAE